MSPSRTRVTGYITAVQEQRFRFRSDHGPVLLLTLGKNVPLSYHRLHALHGSNVHLRLEYSGEPDLASGVVHSIKTIPST